MKSFLAISNIFPACGNCFCDQSRIRYGNWKSLNFMFSLYKRKYSKYLFSRQRKPKLLKLSDNFFFLETDRNSGFTFWAQLCWIFKAFLEILRMYYIKINLCVCIFLLLRLECQSDINLLLLITVYWAMHLTPIIRLDPRIL